MNPRLLAIVLVVIVVASVLFWPMEADTVNEPVLEEDATEDAPATIAWVKVDFQFIGRGPAGQDQAGAEDFDFKSIKVSKGEYFEKVGGTQSMAGLLAQSLKWGTHEWKADVMVTGPKTEMKWTSDTWTKDLPEAKTTDISYATDIFYLSQPGTYTFSVKLIPVGAYAGDSAGKVMAEGSGTFQIPVRWAI
jgi:hypothetical protein